MKKASAKRGAVPDIGGGLLLVGCGKMGEALARGWLSQGIDRRKMIVVEPGRNQSKTARSLGVTVVSDVQAIPASFRPGFVVLAVKPQVMSDVLPPYARFASGRHAACFLSIAAGRTIAGFARVLGSKAAIIRAMPNTPAAIGRGITAAYANRNVSKAMRGNAEALLSAVGEALWVEKETLIDAVTAVSGSGPAYVFYMIEAMAAAGRAAGLPEETAMRLARATVSGAGELAHRSDESAAQLRINVTSPKGTTEAALKVLMAKNGMAALMTRAIAAAARRSRELAS